MILRKFRKYFAFAKAGILDRLAYKFCTFGWLLGDLVSLVILYYLWFAIYKNSPTELINGKNFKDMITYLILARITASLVFSSISFFAIGYDIYEGNIALTLIKPLNYRMSILFSSLGNFLATLVILFIPLFALATLILHF